MGRVLTGQRGQAMILALAFMALAVPIVSSALILSTTLARDARIKTDLLKDQYCTIGAQQTALHLLNLALLETTTTFVCNSDIITTTIAKIVEPPTTIRTTPQGRLETTKQVDPTVQASSTAVTYTLTVTNTKTEAVEPTLIVDLLPLGFKYVSSTTSMKDGAATEISTADPVVSGPVDNRVLTWAVPGSTSLAEGAALTVTFDAVTGLSDGVYCNEAYAEPGGKDVTSGKTAKVTVGSPASGSCKGAAVSISKDVSPEIVFGNTTTTYTYTIEVENEGTEKVSVSELRDTLNGELTYQVNTASSSPVVLGEPAYNTTTNVLTWDLLPNGLTLATSTKWVITFDVRGTLDRGFYPNSVDIVYSRVDWLETALAEACINSPDDVEVDQAIPSRVR